MASNVWTADRRLYLNDKGEVVEADDPARVSLLVATGGTIPMVDAERYGLLTSKPAPSANKAKAPKADK